MDRAFRREQTAGVVGSGLRVSAISGCCSKPQAVMSGSAFTLCQTGPVGPEIDEHG